VQRTIVVQLKPTQQLIHSKMIASVFLANLVTMSPVVSSRLISANMRVGA